MNQTTVERTSDREVVVTRTFESPARLVFEAFTNADLFRHWWVPQSMGMTLLVCELDVRVGGGYRLTFDVGGPEPAEFFGTYLDVAPNARLAWTNEENGDSVSTTTVTFDDVGGRTHLELRERYPSKAVLDATGTGPAEALIETFTQLDLLLASLGGGHDV